MMLKTRKIVGFSVIIIILFLLFYFREPFNLNFINTKSSQENTAENENPLYRNNVVITKFHMGWGKKYFFLIEFATPYNNSDQRRQLTENEGRIKNDFLSYTEEKEISRWVKSRDYEALKSRYLTIVNNYVDKPIKKIYLTKCLIE
jgi:hypothetical protein